MYSIGIIAVAASLKNIMAIDAELQKHCNVTYLAYTSNEHLMYVYQQNVSRFDALLFGGVYTYNVIQEQVGHIPLPFAFFEVADRDYYRMIAQLAIQEPGLDFARVLFDKPESPIDFEILFGRPDVPMVVDEVDTSIPYGDYWPLELNYYEKLWSSGQVDWIVTRFGSMEEDLQRLGIRYKLLLPSRASMLDTFFGLLLQIKQTAPQEGVSYIGMVAPSGGGEEPERLDRLAACITDLNQRLGDIFLLYRHGGHMEITTSMAAFNELTQSHTACPILTVLERALGFPVAIGWGYAHNMITAHQNAARAMEMAQRQGDSASYIVTEDNYVVGPLWGRFEWEMALSAHTRPAEEDFRITKELRRRLCAALTGREEPVFCARELAQALDVTVRSAARILNQLEKAGTARVYEKRSLNQRGRPTKYYQINQASLMER